MAKKKAKPSTRGYATKSIPKPPISIPASPKMEPIPVEEAIVVIDDTTIHDEPKFTREQLFVKDLIENFEKMTIEVRRELEENNVICNALKKDPMVLNVELGDKEQLLKPIKQTINDSTTPLYSNLCKSFIFLLELGFDEDTIQKFLIESKLTCIQDLVQYICVNTENLPKDWVEINQQVGDERESIVVEKVNSIPNINDLQIINQELVVESNFDNRKWIMENIESSHEESEHINPVESQEKVDITLEKNDWVQSAQELAMPSETPCEEQKEQDVQSDISLGDCLGILEQQSHVGNTVLAIDMIELGIANWKGELPSNLLKSLLGTDAKYEFESFPFGYKASIRLDKDQLFVAEKYCKSKIDAKEYIAFVVILQKFPNMNKAQLPSKFRELEKEFNEKEMMRKIKEIGPGTKRKHELITEILNQIEKIKSSPKQTTDYRPKSIINSRSISELTYSDWVVRSQTVSSNLVQSRLSLPAFETKSRIVQTIDACQVVIITGETGSGKSTQVPQFLLEHSHKQNRRFRLVCTQPRRISAISLAARVSKEVGDSAFDKYQNWVGYKVRSESTVNQNTNLIYCTTGILLRELENDPLLASYTHILVDEVHERSLDSDFLLLLLKRIISKRRDLKVALMSATADAVKFSNYFKEVAGEVPILHIPGKTFEVTDYYLEEAINYSGFMFLIGYVLPLESPYRFPLPVETKNNRKATMLKLDAMRRKDPTAYTLEYMDRSKINYDLIVQLINTICIREHHNNNGGILVFLPGVYEIRYLANLLDERLSQRIITLCTLHGRLDKNEQEKAFDPPEKGTRKVVLSTNVAETGITIPDIVYVIDSVKAREVSYDPKLGIKKLMDITISQANAKQRRGRAGRVQAGQCFHLLAKSKFSKLVGHRPPESLRLPLEEIMLMLASDKESMATILQQMIDPPPLKNFNAALQQLKIIGALTEKESITKVGKFLLKLPIDVKLGKMVFYGLLLRCVDPIITLCALISQGINLSISGKASRITRNHRNRNLI